jgi:hypothetical protein
MKYITSALVLLALTSQVEQVDAIKINAKFTDDLVKSLAEEMQKDIEEPAAAEPAKPAAKSVAKPAAKAAPKAALAQKKSNATAKATKKPAAVAVVHKKKEEEEIPMDAAAIKAYSSVIADAAEDSEPSVPVQYSQVIEQEGEVVHRDHEVLGADPIGSMVQNEISSIKMATIKATED